jgi:chaperone modulatory protein CbpM
MANDDMIPAEEFCSHHNIEISFIHSLQDYGLLEIRTVESSHFIPAEQLSEIEKMVRMHYELNINMEGIDVITHLLKQMEDMQSEMNEIRNRLKLFER